ncbi:TIGR03086 family metal-binding protein [Pseudonocardia adelaidensis]|uniref:TIGR03086 family metal-binding protein n=1 Tax=Pseudonocardia adelaidensis TaxID=648754 RepID=A0ABP9NS02_9PSEU
MDNIVELHRRAVAGIRPVLARVTPADLGRPTPCAAWDLRALLEHMTGQDRGFAAAVRAARAGDEVGVSAFEPHPLGPSPTTTLVAGLDEVVAAFAAGADGPVLLAEFDRRLPLEVVAQMHLIDTLVHGWDVAATLGVQDGYVAELDAEVVGAALAMCEQIPDDVSRETIGASFAPSLPAPADADPWTRVLTLLGRDPAWQPRPVRA